MTASIRVEHRGGDKFALSCNHHVVNVDQPVADGGEDTGPSPTELFVASLAACVAHYARRFLRRHGLPTEGLAVTADFTFAERPARVGGITMELRVPDGVPDDRLEALLAVASHCTVHNSLVRPPEVHLELKAPAAPSIDAA